MRFFCTYLTFIRNGSFWDLVTALGHVMILIISIFIVQPEFFSVLSIMFWPDVSGQKDTIPINPLYTIIHKYPDLSLEIASKSYYFISSQVLQFLPHSCPLSVPIRALLAVYCRTVKLPVFYSVRTFVFGS